MPIDDTPTPSPSSDPQDLTRSSLYQIRTLEDPTKCISVSGNNKENGAFYILWVCKNPGQGNTDQLYHIGAEIPSQADIYSYVPGKESKWEGPFSMNKLVAAAAANLPDGRILAWASAFEDFFSNGSKGWTIVVIFDPDTTAADKMRIVDTGHDMFCPGTSYMPDGRILITGGASSALATFYDSKDDTWVKAPPLKIPRGYHGQTVLPDGSVFLLGGSFSGGRGGKIGEVYDINTGDWSTRTGITATGSIITTDYNGIYRQDNHMWLFVAPNGLVFHAGPARQTHWIDVNGGPDGNGTVTPSAVRSEFARMNGNAVMYDIGKILTFGGAEHYQNAEASAEAFVIDINNGTEVTITATSPLNFRRALGNAVILPTGEVLAIGGQYESKIFKDDLSVYKTEMWDPKTGNWTVLEHMTTPRNYHSVALLLKDGRVWASGGGLCGKCNANHFDAEIFIPPYLINPVTGEPKMQPMIVRFPDYVYAGEVFDVAVNSDGTEAFTFSLNRLGAVTHSVDNDTRRIPLPVLSQSGSAFTVKLHANPNIALAGTYFLFAINSEGTPSVARIITVLPPSDDRPTTSPSAAPVDAGPTMSPTTPPPTVSPTLPPTSVTPFFLGTGLIVSEFSNLCLDQDIFSPVGNIHTWFCRGSTNQRFGFYRMGLLYQIRLEHSDECLSVLGGSVVAGANVGQEPCIANAGHQLWELSGGIRNRVVKASHSGQCLSLTGSANQMLNVRANVVVEDCTIAPERRFYLSVFDQ